MLSVATPPSGRARTPQQIGEARRLDTVGAGWWPKSTEQNLTHEEGSARHQGQLVEVEMTRAGRRGGRRTASGPAASTSAARRPLRVLRPESVAAGEYSRESREGGRLLEGIKKLPHQRTSSPPRHAARQQRGRNRRKTFASRTPASAHASCRDRRRREAYRPEERRSMQRKSDIIHRRCA